MRLPLRVGAMKLEKINLIGMLPYKISEDLFKEKIGTGDELKEFENGGFLVKTGNLYELTNKVKPSYTEEEKKGFILDLVNTYYQTKANQIVLSDFETFIENYSTFNNLAIHLFELGEFDRSIETIFKVAKKMTYWGKRYELKKWMDKFTQVNINNRNYLWRQYYSVFADLLPFYRSNIDYSIIEDVFEKHSKRNNDDVTLEIEIGNLEGIYYRIYKKDMSKAIEIHKKYLKALEYYNQYHKDAQQFNLLKGRLLENQAFCYFESNIDKAIEILREAESALRDANDEYELCKLYYYMIDAHSRKDPKINTILNYLDLSMESLEKLKFPDIYRSMMNLFADLEVSQDKDFNKYFRLKTSALESSRVLYEEYIIMDILSIIKTIKTYDLEYGTTIKDSMNPIIEFFKKMEYDEYYHFMLAVQDYLGGRNYYENLDQVHITNLKKLFFEGKVK